MASANPGSSTPRRSDVYGTDTLRMAIVGMTGVGKSAMGNNILALGRLKPGEKWTKGNRPLKSEANPGSVTVNCQKENATIFGDKICIVDTPGLIDTSKPIEETLDEVVKCLGLVEPGPHAIILVVKMDRFTPEVVHGIEKMKNVFGEDCINHTIIVFTHIDSLDEDETLKGFVNLMTGSPRDLLDACKLRYIGFNNKFKALSEDNKEQVKNLIDMVIAVTRYNGGQCYTEEFLEKAKKIEEEKRKKIEEAIAAAEKAGEDKLEAEKKARKEMEKKFKKQIDDLKAEIRKKDDGCFSSDSAVKVRDCQGTITVKSLKDLVVGDLAQSYDPKTSSSTYSPVYFITYQDDDVSMSVLRELFYQGSDGQEHSLRLHGKHLLYATINPSMDSERPPATPVMSEKVNVGDILWVIDSDTDKLCPRPVTKIGDILTSIRHPMTMNHIIIVDGVLASVHLHNEWLLRQATAPLRLLYKISPNLSDLWLLKKAVQAWDYVEHYILV